MGKKVAFESGGGAMQTAMKVSKSARAAAVPAAAVIAFGDAHAFLLVLRFEVQFLQVGAHPRQFLTSHVASISYSSQSKNGLRT